MKWTTPDERRLAAGAALVCAAILLPAAALAASQASATPAHLAAVPRCHGAIGPRGMEVWTALPGDGYAGGVFYDLEFSNVGRHTCTLRGYPRVVAVSGGHQVGRGASHGSQKPLMVTLRPGATAHALLQVAIPGCAGPVSAEIYVYPPGQAYQQTDITASICRHGPTQLGVTQIRSGVGIPFYTLR